jgi:tetratricopeptide (TPR) repeat protein
MLCTLMSLSSFTQGLYPGEVVLLVLGVVLFLLLVIAFFYQLTHQRSLTALLGFFILPIIMIGYPSITSIQYKDGVLSVEKTTDTLLDNPADPQSRQALEKQVQQIAHRSSNNPVDAVTVAKAQFALGHEEDAAQNLQKALSANADLPEALALKTKMELAQSLERLAALVEQKPADQAAKSALQQSVTAATAIKLANPNAITSLARAQAALGDHTAALQTIDKAVAIDPKAAPALKLRATILMRAAPR